MGGLEEFLLLVRPSRDVSLPQVRIPRAVVYFVLTSPFPLKEFEDSAFSFLPLVGRTFLPVLLLEKKALVFSFIPFTLVFLSDSFTQIVRYFSPLHMAVYVRNHPPFETVR